MLDRKKDVIVEKQKKRAVLFLVLQVPSREDEKDVRDGIGSERSKGLNKRSKARKPQGEDEPYWALCSRKWRQRFATASSHRTE